MYLTLGGICQIVYHLSSLGEFQVYLLYSGGAECYNQQAQQLCGSIYFKCIISCSRKVELGVGWAVFDSTVSESQTSSVGWLCYPFGSHKPCWEPYPMPAGWRRAFRGHAGWVCGYLSFLLMLHLSVEKPAEKKTGFSAPRQKWRQNFVT